MTRDGRRLVTSWLRAHPADLVVVVLGAGLVVIALFWRHSEAPIRNGILTTGRIVDHRAVHDESDRSSSHYAVIEFLDERETLHRFSATSTGIGLRGEVGQVVEVRYDAADPARAQWADQPGQGFWKFLLVLGVIVAILGELGVIVARRMFPGLGSGAGFGGERPPTGPVRG